jgi:hypothetical protein
VVSGFWSDLSIKEQEKQCQFCTAGSDCQGTMPIQPFVLKEKTNRVEGSSLAAL